MKKEIVNDIKCLLSRLKDIRDDLKYKVTDLEKILDNVEDLKVSEKVTDIDD